MANCLNSDNNFENAEDNLATTIDGTYLDFVYMLKYIAMDDDFGVLMKAPGSRYRQTIDNYCALKPQCQKLYLRMFLRSQRWFRLEKKNNKYLAHNQDLLTELVNAGFCKDESDIEFDDAVSLLYVKEKEKLMVEMKLKNTYKKLEDLKVGKRSITHFFGKKSPSSSASSIQQAVFKRIKSIIGQCFALNSCDIKVFEDLLIYFSSKAHIANNFISRKSNQSNLKTLAQNTLYNLYKIRNELLILPNYSINHSSDRNSLVKSEDHFTNYCFWARKFYDFFEMVELKRKIEAIDKYLIPVNTNLNLLLDLSSCKAPKFENLENCKELLDLLLDEQCSEIIETNEDKFSPNLSPERFIVKIGSELAEILDSTQQIDKSLLINCKLLLQKKYYKRKRGHWWNRLALNMEKRKNDLPMAIQIIGKGLNDPHTSTPEYYLLARRADRLFRSKKLQQLYDVLPSYFMEIKYLCCKYLENFLPVPSTNLKTKELPSYLAASLGTNNREQKVKPTVQRGKYLKFNREDDSQLPSVEIVSVESYALDYYCNNEKFQYGTHAESSPYISIWGLLFWEIIFCNDIDGVFISPFQLFPLDLYTDRFYPNRKQLIDSRLYWIENCEATELFTSIANTWTNYQGVTQPFVNWELFDNWKTPIDIVDSWSRKMLAGVCKIFSTDYKCRASGLPDLLVWNTMEKSHKIVEVKSTNDKLSHKQIVWIDELLKLGANVEVCNVNKQ